MAYDGIVVSNIIRDIREACLGGRVMKVQQPSNDIITLTIKGHSGQTKLYISINNSLPIVYIADSLPQAPLQAPAFCMLLRKHLGNGKLKDIVQPGFDRIFDFVFEHMDEMGYISDRHLIVEIMGRQSNLILTDSEYKIYDSLKRVLPDFTMEDTDDEKKERIIYPGEIYELPDSQGKLDPIKGLTRESFDIVIAAKKCPLAKAIYTSLSGFSKGISEEVVYRVEKKTSGQIDRENICDLGDEVKDAIYEELLSVIKTIEDGIFTPGIYYKGGQPKDFHSLRLHNFDPIDDSTASQFLDMDETDISTVLRRFYSEKEKTIRVRNSAADIRKKLQSAVERTSKKYDLQLKQLRDTEDRDKYRIYGEMLHTFGYELKGGEDHILCINYYNNREINVPLDPTLSAGENAKKYFDKYNKLKRTNAALSEYLEKTKEELDYLLSVQHSLDIAETSDDVAIIRGELQDSGLIRTGSPRNNGGRPGKAGNSKVRKPQKGESLHFISSDGYDIYVGKNNLQNEELTFDIAAPRDIWFHAKNAAGSHVILRIKGTERNLEDIPDRAFEEAASLAAYYSSASNQPKVEVDYTERKNLKKPPHSRPGYVIYHTNYSITVVPHLIGTAPTIT